ncbi:hypothetical protein KL921_005402 [Ogataea angusta]|nr:hypothetical protein KL921_005402 [Ogataea angusta]KAG7826601.1 hypothetical protein KL920_005413 [Ogataea angusta]
MNKSMEFDKDEFPEGGFGWFVVLASWCGMACTFGMVKSFGVYQSCYQTELYSGEKTFKIIIIGSLQPASQRLHRSLFDPAHYVTFLNAASLFGRILRGFLADVFGRLNVLIPFMLLSGILPSTLWLNSSSSDIIFLIFDVTWGFSSEVVISIFPALVPQLFGVEKNQNRMGLLFTFAEIGALFGQIICGAYLPLAGCVEQYITNFKENRNIYWRTILGGWWIIMLTQTFDLNEFPSNLVVLLLFTKTEHQSMIVSAAV